MAVREFDNCICFLDTETVPSEDKFFFNFKEPMPTLSSVPEHGSMKDPVKIEEWKQTKLASLVDEWKKAKQKAYDEAERIWRSEALESFKGRIIVLCYAKMMERLSNLIHLKARRKCFLSFRKTLSVIRR